MADLLNGTSAEGNSTATFSWEPQPARRGTFSIISTCLVTLALCTWKIVHLNLPGVCPQADLSYSAWWKRGTTTKRHRLVHIFGGHQVTRQIGWLLIALFTPELVEAYPPLVLLDAPWAGGGSFGFMWLILRAGRVHRV